MKIVFICGSLEPGRDGVGDYTRRLAEELIRFGHQVATVALNDKYIEKTISFSEESDGVNVPFLRILSTLSVKQRYAQAKKWIEAFDPEWISLQFVPFAFHTKGLPFDLGRQLANVGKGRRWHIMFHELWIGHNQCWYNYSYLFGHLQKYIILQLCKQLKTSLVTTQAPYYKFLLQGERVKTTVTPLFGNIPIAKPAPQCVWNRISAVIGEKATNLTETRNRIQVGVIFGSIPLVWTPSVLCSVWHKALEQNKKTGILIMMGHHGRPVNELIKAIQIEYPRIWIACLGQLSQLELSQILHECDFGFTPTPMVVLEKSGTVAAMKEHGLPVVVTRTGSTRREYKINRDDLTYLLADMSESSFKWFNRGNIQSKLSNITTDLVHLYEHSTDIKLVL